MQCFDEAIDNLNKIGVEIIIHIILGLPNETKNDMYATVKYVASKKIHGIKLQLLHVLKTPDWLMNMNLTNLKY